jgi:hypothetical protein
MKLEMSRIAAVASLCSITALFTACGGSSSNSTSGSASLYSGKTTQANIGVQSVKNTLASVQEVFPSCNATGLSKPVMDEQSKSVLSVIKIAKSALQPAVSKRIGKSVPLISTTAPSGKTGDCGGTLTYPTYSHSSGTTTMSVKWDNYCTTDSVGNKTTYNGTLSVVDAGTPGASGPVTTKLSASVPILTIVVKNSAGTEISNESVALNGFEYVPATGASAVLSNLPGSTKFTSLEVKDVIKNKEYKLENVTVTTSKVGTDTQLSMTGRIYRGTSGYSDLATETPLLIDSTQNVKSGTISFTGAGGHKATLTAVPGTGQIFTVDVDGTPIAGAQLNCSGL